MWTIASSARANCCSLPGALLYELLSAVSALDLTGLRSRQSEPHSAYEPEAKCPDFEFPIAELPPPKK